MRSKIFVCGLAVFLLLAGFIEGMISPAGAQSGRKPLPQSTGPKYETRDKNDSKEKSDKPLADNTPVTVGDDGTIKLDTTLVTIPASVIDRTGRFAPFLTKRDFRIYEDGVQQEIENVDSVETPFHVVLLLDTSNSTLFRHEDIQQAAADFAEQLRRDDKMMVASFDSDVEVWCDFTNSREEIRRAIYRTKRGGSTKLYDAVDLVVNDALSKIQGRKAIVLFSDGVDTASRYSNARRSLELVEESGALAYSIYYDTEADNPQGGGVTIGSPRTPPIWTPRMPSPPQRRRPGSRWPFDPFTTFQLPQGQWPQGRVPLPGNGGRGDAQQGRKYMEDLANRSGGRFYQTGTYANLSSAFAQIAEELRHQYAISYYPTNSNRDGSYRQVKVRVNDTSLVVRAREGYRAGAATQAQSDDNGRKRPELKRRQLATAN